MTQSNLATDQFPAIEQPRRKAEPATRQAIILINMGAATTPESVEPFLYELFVDPLMIQLPLGRFYQKAFARFISRRRAPKMAPHYQEIGGSPLLPQTEDQARALQKLVDVPVKIAMRYSEPRAKGVMEELAAEGVKEVLALPLYPQFSRTTTETSFVELDELAARLGMRVKYVGRYAGDERYVNALKAKWDETIGDRLAGKENVAVLMTAHGIPVIYAKKGDPYLDEVRCTANKLKAKLPPELPVSLAFQSRLGPVEWARPYLDEEAERLGAAGVKTLVMFPITFVSEHLETNYELDIEVADMAKAAGVEEVIRIPTVRDHPIFIDMLADLATKALAS
ncbi:MAG: ferrochelatase [Deltaproteobacteria bacterium]|nr:ferrochelatase [Deltaproteobacteria bacterium]MCB9478352.1 ferrochelatase [Deltaproteobacteria bacterium]MCB9489336.1 ferrochelatase [Deltaproteobacteria bacterium]